MYAYRIENHNYWDTVDADETVALTKEELKQRFSVADIRELFKEGYKLYEYLLDMEATSRGEFIITKNDIKDRNEISYKKIWNVEL